MAQARRGGQIQSKLGFLIYGNKGTWKSSLAAELGDMLNEKGEKMKVLYIDTENGSIDDLLNQKAAEGIDVSNIYVVYTTSFEEVADFVKQAKSANAKTPIMNRYVDDSGKAVNEPLTNEDGSYFIPDAIVVDSLSVLYDSQVQAITQFSQKRAGVRANRNGLVGAEKAVAIEGAGMEIKDYQTLDFRGKELVLDLMASGKHFVVTAREKAVKKSVKGENGQIQMVDTGEVVPQGFKQVDYNVKTVLHTQVDEDGTVIAIVEDKDRTRVKNQGEIIQNPSLLDWQGVVTNNVDKKEFLVKNSLQEGIEKEIEYQVKSVVENSGGMIDESDFDTKLESLKTEMKDIINNLRANKDKTVMSRLSKLYDDNNVKEKNPDKYKDLESLQKVKDMVVDWAKQNNFDID
jgi:hypothetical protein